MLLNIGVSLQQVDISFVILNLVNNKSLSGQRTIVVSACQHKQVHLLLVVVVGLLLVLFINEIELNMYSLVNEIVGVLKHVLLQVNAAEIVHAAAQFLPILKLVEDLRYFMVV